MSYPTFTLEQSYLDKGYSCVVGIDEVGRGCLAGPVVAAAVVVSSDACVIDGVRDSKLLTEKKREQFYDRITDSVDAYAFGQASVEEIDQKGIGVATELAMTRAYGTLEKKSEVVLIDGLNVKASTLPGERIKSGDKKHYVISAASVIAKVYRDRMMKDFAAEYTEFGFEHHVGYGTRAHMEALQLYGVTKLHRRSFSPIAKLVAKGRLYEGSR